MKKPTTLFASLAAAGLLAASGVATAEPATGQNQQAQPGSATATTQAQQLSEQDKTFIMKAAENNTAEIWLGRLAAKRAQGEPAKALAEEIIKDHKQVAEVLKETMQTMGLKPPAMAIREAQMEQYERLATVPRVEFDAAYLKSQVKAHEKTIALFQQQVDEGQAKPLVEFAEKRIPTLEEHLQHARELASQL